MLLVVDPNQASCTNSQHTDGISIHVLPDEEKAPEIKKKWVRFVQKHRPHFASSRLISSLLCAFRGIVIYDEC